MKGLWGTKKGQSATEVVLILAVLLLVVVAAYTLVTSTKSVTKGDVTVDGQNMSVQEALNNSLNDLRNVSTMPVGKDAGIKGDALC